IGIGTPCIPAENDYQIFFLVKDGLNHPYSERYIYGDSGVVAILPATQANIDAIVAITGEMNEPDRISVLETIATIIVFTVGFGWQCILAFFGVVFLVTFLRNRLNSGQSGRKQKPKPE
ncbi:MAG: hypothetical protein AAFN11_12025, partial [Chloroflexota bacterium]